MARFCSLMRCAGTLDSSPSTRRRAQRASAIRRNRSIGEGCPSGDMAMPLRNWLRYALMVGLLLEADATRGEIFTTIDLSAYCNNSLQTFANGREHTSLYPKGSVVLGGVPFSIPEHGNNAWDAARIAPSGTVTLDVPIGVYGLSEVHTLIFTSKGLADGNSYACLQFFGSGGGFYEKSLYGNIDMRDWHQGDYTNTINGTTTLNVWTVGSGYHDENRLDMQNIALPGAFTTQTLTMMRIVDNGYYTDSPAPGQRIFLSGLTVASVPEPSTFRILLAAVACLLGYVLLRRGMRQGILAPRADECAE
jgi:hypothetical protein